MNEVGDYKKTVQVLCTLLADTQRYADSTTEELRGVRNSSFDSLRRLNEVRNLIATDKTIRMSKDVREKLLKLLDYEGGI